MKTKTYAAPHVRTARRGGRQLAGSIVPRAHFEERPNFDNQLEVVAPDNMDAEELSKRFRHFGRQARSLCGVVNVEGVQRPLGQVMGDFFDSMAGGLNDPATLAKRNEFMAKVEAGDGEAKKQFCALRLETYNNYLFAQLDWIAQYFQVIKLGMDERPLVQNTYTQEVKAYYVGQDGTPKSQKVQKQDVETALPLRVLTTPLMRYKVVDIYRGNIVDQAVKTLTLSRDMAQKMEAEAFKLMQASAFGVFTFTGVRATWPYVANSYINTANLPATNDVPVLNTNGKFDFPVLDEIINYAACVNGALSEDAQMEFKPTGRVRVAASVIRWFGTNAGTYSPTAPLASASEQEILAKGWITVNYKGIKWTFIPDLSMDPTVNQVYPEFTIKPGRIYTKPSLDMEFIRSGKDDFRLFESNEELRAVKKVYAAYFNSARRMYFARFNF